MSCFIKYEKLFWARNERTRKSKMQDNFFAHRHCLSIWRHASCIFVFKRSSKLSSVARYSTLPTKHQSHIVLICSLRDSAIIDDANSQKKRITSLIIYKTLKQKSMWKQVLCKLKDFILSSIHDHVGYKLTDYLFYS